MNWRSFVHSRWAIAVLSLALFGLGSWIGTDYAGEWLQLWRWLTATMSGLMKFWTWMTNKPESMWSAIGAVINLGLGVLAYKAFREARRSAQATQIQAEAALTTVRESQEANRASRIPRVAFHVKFPEGKYSIYITNYSEKHIVLDNVLMELSSEKYSYTWIPDSEWPSLGIETAERRVLPVGDEVRFFSSIGNPTFRGEVMTSYTYYLTHDFTYAGENHYVKLTIRVNGTRVEVDDDPVTLGLPPQP